MKNHIQFSKGLKIAREARGLTQSDLGKIAGLNPTAIAHFETGKRSPSLLNLRRLVTALQISADFFIGITDSMMTITLSEEMACDLSKLSNDDLMLIKKMIAILAERNNHA
jgi:transcriptional regulator with XRE-family HTH domain